MKGSKFNIQVMEEHRSSQNSGFQNKITCLKFGKKLGQKLILDQTLHLKGPNEGYLFHV